MKRFETFLQTGNSKTIDIDPFYVAAICAGQIVGTTDIMLSNGGILSVKHQVAEVRQAMIGKPSNGHAPEQFIREKITDQLSAAMHEAKQRG